MTSRLQLFVHCKPGAKSCPACGRREPPPLEMFLRIQWPSRKTRQMHGPGLWAVPGLSGHEGNGGHHNARRSTQQLLSQALLLGVLSANTSLIHAWPRPADRARRRRGPSSGGPPGSLSGLRSAMRLEFKHAFIHASLRGSRFELLSKG